LNACFQTRVFSGDAQEATILKLTFGPHPCNSQMVFTKAIAQTLANGALHQFLHQGETECKQGGKWKEAEQEGTRSKSHYPVPAGRRADQTSICPIIEFLCVGQYEWNCKFLVKCRTYNSVYER